MGKAGAAVNGAAGSATVGETSPIPGHGRIAVCVPVRDERAHLPDLLAAFQGQTVPADAFVLCLLFDGDRDGGMDYVRSRAPTLAYEMVTQRLARQPQANAGRARRAAMALGSRTLADASQSLLLSTDADTVPDADWVAANARVLQAVDVVAGHIARPDATRFEIHRRLERYWERLRCLQRTIDPVAHDPAPSHACQGGASLGFRASIYAALGGFEPVAAQEDERLVTAARRAGYRVCHHRDVRVATSSRLTGRARRGLADTLRARQASTCLPQVEDPQIAAARFQTSALGRRYFEQRDDALLADLAARLGRVPDETEDLAKACGNAEAFSMSVVPEPERDGADAISNPNSIALPLAETRLAELERDYRCPTP